MNLLKTAEFKVGLLVIGILALIGYMTIGVSEDPSYLGRSKTHWFLVDNASGLIKNSAIKMAGINVGVIKDIKLYQGKARLDITIDPEIKLTDKARIEIRAQGILGDRYVEVVMDPTPGEELKDGEQIVSVMDKGSLDAIMNQVGTLTGSLSEISETLKESMTGDGDDKSPVGRIISNLETLTGDIAEITSEKKDEMKDIVDNLHDITGEIKALIDDPSEEGFKASFAKLNRGLARVDKITQNFEEVSDKLNSGKGTLGKLINDEKTVDELNTAIAGVNDFIGTASKTQMSFDFHTEYLSEADAAKTYMGVRIQPGLDRFYELGVIDDPKGKIEREIRDTSNNGGPVNTQDQTITYKNKVKFTALFAKNFYDFTVKAGLMENTGGIGFEYNLFYRKLRLSFDAFDFAADQPHLRAGIRYNLIHGIYLVGGGDDFADSDEVSGYLGAGIDLTNDDLKLLLSKMSF